MREVLDITSELFKGELGPIYEIENNYSLKTLEEYRRIRSDRLRKQAEEEKARQDEIQRKREREATHR